MHEPVESSSSNRRGVVPPPVEAPPVVGPFRGDADAPPTRSRIRRLVRDLNIGGACLLVGLVVGQWWTSSGPTADSPDAVVAVAVEQPVTTTRFATESTMAAEPTIVEDSDFVASSTSVDIDEVAAPLVEVVAVEAPIDTEVMDVDVNSQATMIAETSSVPEIVTIEDQVTADEITADEITADNVTEGNAEEEITAEPIEAGETLTASADLPPSIDALAMLKSQSSLKPATCEDGTCPKPGKSLGTSLQWAETPADAYRDAGEQDKLVFLIHVSGNFEIPGFT